jgi:negative regulator of flagellin synthesis FlgM
MVDPIGIKAGTVGERRPVQLDAAKAVEAPQAPRPVSAEPQPAAAATQLSSAMAAQAPVDTDRVARIKKAIADGRFPTVPATIADRLLALKMEWDPNDKA